MFRNILAAISIAITGVVIAGTSALAKPADSKQAHEQVVAITVTSAGFEPAQVDVKANQPVKLVVTRKTDQTCAKTIVIKDFGIEKALPLDQPVEVTFTPTKSGQIRYACAMNMVAGVIIVK
jgi:plastocyanin domain-containing protein